jgi:hypothetical protein
LAAERRLGSSSSAGITDDETSVQFLDGPRRREAARFIGAGCLLGRTGL